MIKMRRIKTKTKSVHILVSENFHRYLESERIKIGNNINRKCGINRMPSIIDVTDMLAKKKRRFI
jgi:hypothetical protein